MKIRTFLMFDGNNAEEAMNLYVSAFRNSEIISVSRYEAGQPGQEGTIQKAEFTLNGQEFVCIDSNFRHAFSFTPSVSIFVTTEDAGEIDELFHKLGEDGQVFMPMGEYPFSKKYVWFADKFGLSWQLSLI